MQNFILAIVIGLLLMAIALGDHEAAMVVDRTLSPVSAGIDAKRCELLEKAGHPDIYFKEYLSEGC